MLPMHIKTTAHWVWITLPCTGMQWSWYARSINMWCYSVWLHNLIHSTSAVSIILCGNIELQGCITLMYWKWSMNFINLKKPQKIKELSLLWLIVPWKERKENLLLIWDKAECTRKKNKFCDQRCSEKCPRVISWDERCRKACKVVIYQTAQDKGQ